MSTNCPISVHSDNLSFAWGKAFLHSMNTSAQNLSPLIVSISGFHAMPLEHSGVRKAVDATLSRFNKVSARVSAFTIFPESYWASLGKPDCDTLSSGYLKEILPRMRAQNSLNRYGTYFERMVAFHGTVRSGEEFKQNSTNQLDHIIEQWRKLGRQGKRPRHSALVVSCFDPSKDHTGQLLRGFPCLTQVSFGYDDEGGLSLSAFYPTQYLFDRAYGNYLGLAHLGQFMAKEMSLSLKRLNFFIGRPEIGSVPKRDLSELAAYVKEIVDKDALVKDTK